MDFDLPLDRERPIPVWSVKNGIKFCSIGGSPDEISPEITDYLGQPPTYPGITNSRGVLLELDYENFAVRYDSKRHWLGYVSKQALSGPEEDEASFIFEQNEVELISEYERVEGSSDSDGDGGTHLVGFFIANSWNLNTIWMSERLNDIIMSVVLKTDFYGPNAWSNRLGDIPAQVDGKELEKLFYKENIAQTAAGNARRTILEQMAFLSWFSTIMPGWKDDLSMDDQTFVETLRLDERPKTGFVFSIEQDYHEMNAYHLMKHGIPFHFAWTKKEENSARFVRYSPKFMEEYEALKAARSGQSVNLRELPSFELWKDDLERFDIFFQDVYSGRMGEMLTEFRPDWEYHLVDFLHYGAHPIDSRQARRACAERFKATLKRTLQGHVCTFFRQNPIRPFQPGETLIYTDEHEIPIESFGEEDATGISEESVFLEDIFEVRERVKNRSAPRPDRRYNTYNGLLSGPNASSSPYPQPAPQSGPSRLAPLVDKQVSQERGRILSLRERIRGTDLRRARSPMSPTHRSDPPEAQGLLSEWAQGMANEGPRRRSSRSLSPWDNNRRREGNSRRRSVTLDPERSEGEVSEGESEFEREQQRRRNFYTEGVEPQSFEAEPARESPVRDPIFRGGFRTRREAVDAIGYWSKPIVELEAPHEGLNRPWRWNSEWLEKAVLICTDQRTLVRLKVWAACSPRMNTITDVLEMAILSGAEFSLQLDIRDVQLLKEKELDSLDLATLFAFYEQGYVDSPLRYEGGGASAYFRYRAILNDLLHRPHAIAFICKGGILSFIAQLYDEELVSRFIKGPSPQVLSYQKGSMMRTEESLFYTTDQVSESEISLLLGQVVTGDAATERTLWPKPEWVEEFCPHAHGVWTPGYMAMLNNLAKSIIKERRYVWRKRSEWVSYLINSGRGSFLPAPSPSKEDYEEGAAMIERAFPIRWNFKRLSEITIPEKFDTRN
ncbi:hypothetical protein C8R43DRAFT_1139988 [Mycena crocata]|nr:hypothetical protein C8R43DRAFT_1139988 [Mycena crocata]